MNVLRTKMLVFAVIFLFTLTGALFAGNTWDVTMVPGSSSTMGDATATISFIVTNTGNGKNVKDNVIFRVDTTNFHISGLTTAPEGWLIDWLDPDSISFTDTNDGIPPGGNRDDRPRCRARACGRRQNRSLRVARRVRT